MSLDIWDTWLYQCWICMAITLSWPNFILKCGGGGIFKSNSFWRWHFDDIYQKNVISVTIHYYQLNTNWNTWTIKHWLDQFRNSDHFQGVCIFHWVEYILSWMWVIHIANLLHYFYHWATFFSISIEITSYNRPNWI